MSWSQIRKTILPIAEEKIHAIIPEITRLNPFDLKPAYDFEREGAISSFRSSGKSPKEWASEFDFSEPVKVSLFNDGSLVVTDGHHRQLAAQILGRSVPVTLRAINAEQSKIDELAANQPTALAFSDERREELLKRLATESYESIHSLVEITVHGTGRQLWVDPNSDVWRTSGTHESWASNYLRDNDISWRGMARNELMTRGWTRIWMSDSLEVETAFPREFIDNHLPFVARKLGIDGDIKITIDHYDPEEDYSTPIYSSPGLLRDFVTEATSTGKIATSSSLDGIKDLITKFYAGSTVTLASVKEGLWSVATGKGTQSGVEVVYSRGRYVFQYKASSVTEDTFKYGMMLRPAGPNTVEPGYISYDPDFKLELPPNKDHFIRHGVVTYDHELPDERVKKWELIPIENEGYLRRVAEMLAKKIQKYAKAGIAIFDDEDRLEDFLREFWGNEKTPLVHPVEHSKVIEMAKAMANPVQESIEENSKVEHSKHSTQVNLEDCPDSEPLMELFKSIQDKISEEDTYEEEGGKEDEVHVTLLYGLTDENDLPEAKKMLSLMEPFEMEFGEISSFRNEENPYDVLIIEMKGEGLYECNRLLKTLTYENSYPDYKPHMTLAYVQKGVGKDLEGPCELTGKKALVTKAEWSHKDHSKVAMPIGVQTDPIDEARKATGIKISVPKDSGHDIDFIAQLDGKVVGRIFGGYRGTEDGYFDPYDAVPFVDQLKEFEEVVELTDLHVDPAYRGKGIADALMKKFVASAKRFNAPIFILASPYGGSSISLTNLVSLYAKHGFKEIIRYPRHHNSLMMMNGPEISGTPYIAESKPWRKVMDEAMNLKPMQWTMPTEEQIKDEFNEMEVSELLLGWGYPTPKERADAFDFFKVNLDEIEIDPKDLKGKNAWRFTFPDYHTFRKQVTGYGGPKDPDSMVRKVQSGGSLPMPVVIRRANGTYELAGGATRTSIALLAGQKIKALSFDETKALARWIVKAKSKIADFLRKGEAKHPNIREMNRQIEKKVHEMSPEDFKVWKKGPMDDEGKFEWFYLAELWRQIRDYEDKIAGKFEESSQAESIEEPYQSWRKFMEAPDWAHDVGGIRAELGEIEEIYKDFDHIYSRFNGIVDVLPPVFQTKMINALGRAYKMLQGAESLFREVTHTGKAPRRNPIVHSQPTVSPKQEMERISMDLAKLSVRVRNIGQATADVEHVDIKHVRDMFEKASEILRRTFVEFERHIP